MNVLCIGNSFSQDATRYLHRIARADGKNLTTVNLYIGGCSLDKHYRNMLSDACCYEMQFNGENTGFHVSLSEGLLNRKWDVVTLQQVSSLSFNKSSYEPYIIRLAEFVRECAPKAKIYMHQTWAYEDGSDRLASTGYESAMDMRRDAVEAYDYAAKLINADGIIRSGELFGALLKNGIQKIHRDTFHATLGLGRYALGLLWYRTLMGGDVINNSFCDLDAPITAEEIEIVKATVNNL